MDFLQDYVYRLDIIFSEEEKLTVHVISENDKSIEAIEEQLYDKYYHKEPDRSKYTFKKLWTVDMSMKIGVLADKAYNYNSN
jgi:hypothetical protein